MLSVRLYGTGGRMNEYEVRLEVIIFESLEGKKEGGRAEDKRLTAKVTLLGSKYLLLNTTGSLFPLLFSKSTLIHPTVSKYRPLSKLMDLESSWIQSRIWVCPPNMRIGVSGWRERIAVNTRGQLSRWTGMWLFEVK